MAFEIPSNIPGASKGNSIIGPLQGGPDAAQREAAAAPNLGKATYVSPKGAKISGDWQVLRREFTLRNTPYEFPEVNDAYVQLNGFGPRRYPMRWIFSGVDHEKVATGFEAALLEDGVGTLYHPRFGTFKVVPVGDVVRDEDPVSAAYQTIVEVVFWTTTGIVYPSSAKSAKNEIEAQLDAYLAASSGQFGGAVNVGSTVARVNVMARIKKIMRQIDAAVGAIARAQVELNRPFRDGMRALNLGLDTLVGAPLQLAQKLINLTTGPARAAIGIESRLAAYRDLGRRITTGPVAASGLVLGGIAGASGRLFGLRLRESNNFLSDDLVVGASVAGSVAAALTTEYQTRNQAVAAAEEVLAQIAVAVAWRDERYESLELTDTGEAYQALLQAVSLVAGYLVSAPASAGGSTGAGASRFAVERRIILDRPRTIIDLCAELYGEVDDKLDFLINTNNLSGSDLLELKAGRQIAYYV